MADFVGKQFSKDEVAEKVLEQYDEEHTRIFYQCVMGGGGHDIHFGLFKSPDEGVKESGDNTTNFMCDSMNWAAPVTKDSVVLDLGSGHGGGTHAMVTKFGCTVDCFNLGPEQNAMNMARCKELGIDDKVSTHVGNLNNPLPAEWTNRFDFVWSCEVFCHAGDKAALLTEIYRVLKPGGILVFSDLMGADGADEELLRSFTDRNATTVMGRPSKYLEAIKAGGLDYMMWWDGSHHLEQYFRCMVSLIDNTGDEMRAKGLTDQYLANWHGSLSDRANMQRDHGVFAWGVFLARKNPRTAK
jgi:sarcosine/dimethylglycine N-methyltransferase